MKETTKTYGNSSKREEILNSAFHAFGILLGLAGLVLLLLQGIRTGNPLYIVAVGIYGVSFTWTYITSTLYHSFFRARVKTRNLLHLLDHTAIYFFIAGTYTPIALFALPEIWNVSVLIGVWTLAALGIILKIFSIGKHRKLSLAFYLLMGWLILIASKPMISTAPPALLYWLLAGALVYSLGTIFFSLRKMKYSHPIWHLCVLGGSICHFYGIYNYLEMS